MAGQNCNINITAITLSPNPGVATTVNLEYKRQIDPSWNLIRNNAVVNADGTLDPSELVTLTYGTLYDLRATNSCGSYSETAICATTTTTTTAGTTTAPTTTTTTTSASDLDAGQYDALRIGVLSGLCTSDTYVYRTAGAASSDSVGRTATVSWTADNGCTLVESYTFAPAAIESEHKIINLGCNGACSDFNGLVTDVS